MGSWYQVRTIHVTPQLKLYKSMADGLGVMKQYGTFSNTAPVLLQRPSDDTRNMQLHRCISMSRADEPSSDLRTNSTIVTSCDDMCTTMVINAGSGGGQPWHSILDWLHNLPVPNRHISMQEQTHNIVTRSRASQ